MRAPSLDQYTSDECDEASNVLTALPKPEVLDVGVHTPPPMRPRSLSHCGPVDQLVKTKFDRDERDRLRRIVNEKPGLVKTDARDSGGTGKSSVPSSPTNNDTDSPGNSLKQARFHEDVDVFHHDAEGKLAFKNCVRLKPGDAGWKWTNQEWDDDAFPGLAIAKPTHSRKHIFPVEDVEVRWADDNKKYLRLVINLGRKLSEGRISLRALKDGSKLILTVQILEPLGDGTEFMRQYMDRFVLPQPIHSERIEATPGGNGKLVVEALLL